MSLQSRLVGKPLRLTKGYQRVADSGSGRSCFGGDMSDISRSRLPWREFVSVLVIGSQLAGAPLTLAAPVGLPSLETAAETLATPVSEIPLGCQESLSPLGGKVGKCSKVFPPCKKVKEEVEDLLLQQVVTRRISKLYEGHSQLVDPKGVGDGKYLTESGSGASAACNMSCGEGMIEPSSGDPFSFAAELQSGRRAEDVASLMMASLTSDMIDKNFNISRGVFETPAGQRPQLKTCGGWPIWSQGSDKSRAFSDRAGSGRDGTWDWFDDNLCHDERVTWLESGAGGKDCAGVLIGDVKAATGITSRQLGMLVQAHWIKLHEVLEEMKSTGKLTLSDPVCRAKAGMLMKEVKKAATAMDKAEACEDSAKMDFESAAACNSADDTPGGTGRQQAACQVRAIRTAISGAGIPSIAECEVYARAGTMFEAAFEPGKWLPEHQSIKRRAVELCRDPWFEVDLDEDSNREKFVGRNVCEATNPHWDGDDHFSNMTPMPLCFPVMFTALFYEAKVKKSGANPGFELIKGFQDSYVSPSKKVTINKCQISVKGGAGGK